MSFKSFSEVIEKALDLPLKKAMACPRATQDVELNTKNRDAAIRSDVIKYGPLNIDEPGDYWKDLADHWDTTQDAAKKSLCGNCVAFDISPRMDKCMPGEISDDSGRLGYCWMHHFKCHSARTCYTWAKGGPIEADDVSEDWQERAGMSKSQKPSPDVSFSSLLQKAKYTKPKLRERLKAKILAGSKGGKPGQWSARKAQLLALEYEKAGGGYRGRKNKKQKDLDTWTEQDWQTPSGKPSGKSGEVYAPKRTISALRSTKEGRKKLKQATRKKRKATKEGKQFARHGLHEGKTRKGAGVDERVWSRAKKIAEESGQAENWAYVTGIYKRLMGEDTKKSARYESIDFKPPRSVANAAKLGLKLRRKAPPSKRGGLTTAQAAEEGIGSGVQRAVDLKNRRKMSPDTIKRMLAFFSRHEKNKDIDPGKEPHEDRGYVAWLLWGGDPGLAWAKRIKARMDRADKEAK